MALSIFVPIGYITVLVVSLSIFSRVYRKRTAEALVREHGQPWFPEGHPERDIYQTLVQAAAGTESNASAVPDVVLKAALLNRAMADVRRILRMREDKQALGVLLQKGSIGDETMAKFTMAEKELEAEILDVVSEANTFREGWGQIIFPTASEMVAHLKHKDIYYGVAQQREEEIKKLKEAGKAIPQPTVALPPLITPPGTSITVQAPQPPAGVNVPLTNGTQEQKLAALAQALAQNKAMLEAQSASGTVQEVQDEVS